MPTTNRPCTHHLPIWGSSDHMCPLFPNHHHPPGLAPTAHRARAVRRSGARHKADPCSTPQNLSGGLLRASRGLDTLCLLIFAGRNQRTAPIGYLPGPSVYTGFAVYTLGPCRALSTSHHMTKPGQTLHMGGQHDPSGVQDVLYITNFHSYGHEWCALARGSQGHHSTPIQGT